MNLSNRELVGVALQFYADEKNWIPQIQDWGEQILPMSQIDIDRGELAKVARQVILHEKGAKKRLKIALTKRGIKIPKGV